MNCSFRLFKYDHQLCNDAISKLHGSGSAVPKKITGKYIYTLDAIAAANNRIYGNKILILADYGSQNDVETLFSQVSTDLRYGVGLPQQETVKINVAGAEVEYTQNKVDADGNIVYMNSIFKDFRENVGYDTTLINLKKYVDSESAAKSAGAKNINEDVNGQIVIKYISALVKNVNADPTGYSYYDGSDLTVDNYTLLIMFTKLLPFHDITDNYNNDKYRPYYDHVVDVNEYSPQLGLNIKNFIDAGGNVILGNNVWQKLTSNSGIPNFGYNGIPFYYNNNYQSAETTYAVNKINLLFPSHPILKTCGPNLLLEKPSDINPSVVKNIIVNADASVLATIADPVLAGQPFLAININANGGRAVAINSYLGIVSTNNRGGNREFAKIIFNAIYWCFKINN